MKKTATYITIILGFIFLSIIIIGGGFGSDELLSLNNGNPIIFAHRGVTIQAVENSMESFIKSKAVGFKAVETDIRCTKDKKLIVFHDDSGKRLLNIDKDISDLNWDEIKNLKLRKNGVESNNEVLSLEQFLQQTPTSFILYLDVKEPSKCLADQLIQLLEKYKDHQNIIIADGNLFFLAYLKLQHPHIKVALEGFNKGKEWIYYITPKKFKPDFYSSFLQEVDEDHMTFLMNKHLLNNRIVYGVDAGNLDRVYELGLQHIIFDYNRKSGPVQEIEHLLQANKQD